MYDGAWLMLEWPTPRHDKPWVLEKETARWGVWSVESFTLEDVEEE